MVNWQGLDEQLKMIEPQVEKRQAKVKIPWDKIDEWIANLSDVGQAPQSAPAVDPGDRRN